MADGREPMESKEDVILFLGNRVLVGELDTRNCMLRYVMELFSQTIPGTDDQGNIRGFRQFNEVIPLFGTVDAVTMSLSPEATKAAIRFADLSKEDARELSLKVANAKKRQAEARAARSGITLATQMPKGPLA